MYIFDIWDEFQSMEGEVLWIISLKDFDKYKNTISNIIPCFDCLADMETMISVRITISSEVLSKSHIVWNETFYWCTYKCLWMKIIKNSILSVNLGNCFYIASI